jgi:cystathionine beta-lyase/cystathionine gamma-synthase
MEIKATLFKFGKTIIGDLMTQLKSHRIFTKAVHQKSEQHIDGALQTPIFQTSTFVTERMGDPEDIRYTRLSNNPSQESVSAKIAYLENAEAALVTASGMAAIATALFAELSRDDHAIFQRDIYGGTHSLLTNDFPVMSIQHDFFDLPDTESLLKLIRPNTKVIYLESISNPLMNVPEFETIVKIARKHDIKVFVDNTFATPILFRPAEVGCDVVLHSCTKYLNGHSDLIAGAIVSDSAFIDKCRKKLNRLGASLDPHACFLLERGIKTLGVRIRQHCKNAAALAVMLAQHPKIGKVYYPGLETHPANAAARRYFDDFGGMLSFELDGSEQAVLTFIKQLQIPVFAPSLGGVETLITIPAMTSHLGLSPSEKKNLGITNQLVRISTGIEDTDDLLEDFQQALAKI